MSSEHEATTVSQEVPLTHTEICGKMVIWIVSLLIIVVNVVVDVITLILYFDSEEYVFFVFTFIFLAVPSLVIAVASLIWLWDADRRPGREDERSRAKDSELTSTTVLLHLTLLGIVYRYGRLIMKCTNRQQSGIIKTWERDAHFPMFIQTILHCCGQLVVQLYIIGDDTEDSSFIPMTIICASVNLIAILWALFIYTVDNTFKDTDITVISKLIIFTWHVCIIISRILTVAFFTVAFHAFVFIPVGVHWSIWTILVFFMSTEFCADLNVQPQKKRPYLELPFDVVVGFMLLFFYFNAKKGNTRYVMTPYHIFTFVETAALSVTFYIEMPNEWYSLLVLCLSIMLYLIGSILILLYYSMLHPKTKLNRQQNHNQQNHNGSTVRINTTRQGSNESSDNL